MKIKGLKKTISELRKCPRGWGLRVGYNAKTNELFTSGVCQKYGGWLSFKEYEFSIGYFSGDYPITMKDLEVQVRRRLDYCHILSINYKRKAWADKALAQLS